MRKRLLLSLILLAVMQIADAQTAAPKTAANAPAAKKTSSVSSNITGRFELYSGVPTIYLGHIIILADGKYKVAFANAETNYENGTYVYHPDTNNIEWLTGLFRNKNWEGKITPKPGGYRIEFNKTTFAEK